MANFVENSQINLSINAKQANMVLDTMKQKADDLRKKIDAAANAGDTKRVRQLTQELRRVEDVIRQSTTDTYSLEQAMRRLDKASPKELNKTLRTLTTQLNRMERGSEAWNAHVEKIRRVRAELNNLRQSLEVQQSTWERFNGWLNNCQTAIMAFIGAITGLILAGKDAVKQYAEMEQEMANVRKYTGMTAEEVDSLNEAFRQIDTRSPRTELNKLAQEAGRLGKSSEQDVLGFVRAADKINVSLDDLGDGATLQLSKLTGIFGDEARYGTELSLMKVGSVINELSQNCSASAPYIADFTERLGGVGAQAGMTIQQIMGFAAVLDSNAQKVEASATALSQIIVRLYQEPEKYARVAGMDAKKFADLMRKDANKAVLEFLETLNKAGGMDVLSPMFKDMGENGSRAIAALSTLATNIDAVRQQQEAANIAFYEGTSIQKEFDVQNNTVQAGLDKSRNELDELAVSLGKKLMPVMSMFYSSSSVCLHALSVLCDFISQNYKTIIVLTSAIAAYSVAVEYATIKTKLFTVAKTAGLAIIKAYPAALLLCDAAYALLHGDIKLATQALRQFSTVVKANPVGLLTAAVTAAAVAFVALRKRTDEYNDTAKKIIKTTQETTENTVKEHRELDTLFGKLKGAKEGSESYLDAKKKIIDQYGRYLSGLIDEKGQIIDLTKAYHTLSEAIKRSARERSLAHAKEELENTYNQRTAADLTALQKALENYGESAEEAARITQIVSDAIISGNAIPDNIRAKVEKASASMPVSDSDGKEYTNSGQRWFAKAGLANKAPEAPDKILDRLERAVGDFDKSVDVIENMQREVNPTFELTTEELQATVKALDQVIKDGSGSVMIPNAFLDSNDFTSGYSRQDYIGDTAAKIMRETIAYELNLRGKELYKKENTEPEKPQGSYTPEEKESVLNKRFREELKAVEAKREDAIEKATVRNAAGLTNWLQFLRAKHKAEMDFYAESEAVYKKWNKTQDEGCRQLLRKKSEEERSWAERTSAISIEEVKRRQKIEETMVRQKYADRTKMDRDTQLRMEGELFDIKLKAMQKELKLTNKGSKEYADKKLAIEQALAEHQLQVKQRFAQEAARIEQKYAKMSATAKFVAEMNALRMVRAHNKITQEQYDSYTEQLKEKYIPGGKPKKEKTEVEKAREEYAKQKEILDDMFSKNLIKHKEYVERSKNLEKELQDSIISGIANSGSEWVNVLTNMYKAWADFAEALKDPDGNPLNALSAGLQSTAAVMGAVMQSVTQLTEAELQIQVKKVEERYDREIAYAEGNSYMQAKLEKKKEKEIAKMKSDASKKNFQMQVAMTVASTAANAVSAYGAALQVGGMAGLILAPVAAGLALAQGAVQIAALKKQQEAAAATGYSEGGYTRKGRKDEPAGIVHAGEWVASQKLVNNPRVRPVIDLLEYAQRTNTVPSLTMEDVSMSVSAPMRIASSASRQQDFQYSGSMPTVTVRQAQDPELSGVLSRLADRLDKPFITHNSILGPKGFKETKDEYDRLMANKSR